VAGPKARTVVAVEILIKQDQVAPMWIVLELGSPAVDRPLPFGIAQKGARQPADDLLRYFEQRHVLTGPGRTLNFEVVAVEAVKIHQCADDQRIDRHPDRTTPVGIAAEHARI